MVIQQTLLNHKGGIYFYRVHKNKISNLCKDNEQLIRLKDYLNNLFEYCPNEFFNNGPRSSLLRFNLVTDLNSVQDHEVSALAKMGLEINSSRFKDNHSKVQMCMLEYDKKTIAMEIPIWLKPEEFAEYESVFKSKDVLTGHIDLIRIDNENIWIWDYKPNAHREKYASTQIFFYAMMLSKRCNLPLRLFRCGYFDHNHAFTFNPKEELLLRLNKQKLLNDSF